MMETTLFKIGADVRCSDGTCGEVSRVVVDPITSTVTHLVVEPKHRLGLGRLVPLSEVKEADGVVELQCTQAEFDDLDGAEVTEYLPGIDDSGRYEHGEVLYHPFFALANGGLGTGQGAAELVTYDSIPSGDVAVRRGEQVHAIDGEIGRVQGLVIETQSHHVSHVLLQEGHLWGRKEIAIPIAVVTGVEHGIRLSISKSDVEALPPVNLDRARQVDYQPRDIRTGSVPSSRFEEGAKR
jgi:sporulation protein YlmC with PRC-barrel domain